MSVNVSERTKLIIMGFAPSSRDDAPFDDPSFEVWGLNDLYRLIPRGDRWFEMHDRELIEAHPYVRDHLKELRESNIPVYMQERFPDIPHAIRYPIEELIRYFFGDDIPEGTTDSDLMYYGYFTNTISYMLAVAIYEGKWEEIHLYGVDMCADSEYGNQRPSVEFFIGFARGRGIKVKISPKSDLLRTIYPYGYKERNPFRQRMKARIEGHEKEINDFINQRAKMITDFDNMSKDFKEQIAQLDGSINHLRGRVAEDGYYLKVWSPYSGLSKEAPQDK